MRGRILVRVARSQSSAGRFSRIPELTRSSYTCGARWYTCSCTEADQIRRQEEIETRRAERDQQVQREAAEVAAALAEIERMELREAQERAQREEERCRQEAERRRKEEDDDR